MPSILLKTPEAEQPVDNRWRFGQHDLLLKSARQSTRHRLTDDPSDAEIILFSSGGPEPLFGSITHSEEYRRHPAKCFVFDQADHPLALLPGVYASIEKSWYDPRWTRSGFYVHIDEEHRFHVQPWQEEMPYLFSFVGSCSNAPVRTRLRALDDPRGRVVDTSGQVTPAYTTGDADAIRRLNQSYTDTVRESRFVLCPRGVGCSSQRIFEVMRMGRAPVILADEWVPPVGPEWERFSVTIPEADVLELPRLLASRESDAREMGIVARQQWERWFAPPVLFDTVADWCLDIQRAGKCGDRWFRRRKYFQLLRPYHARDYLRDLKNAWKSRRS